MVLVGNKCDIEQPEVDDFLVQDFRSKHKMTYIEASAKNNINVSEIFTTLVDIIIKLDEESNGLNRRTRSKIGKIISTTTTEEEQELEKKKRRNCC